MVTLLRGLRRDAISTLKRSVLARSNSPPSRKIVPLFFKPLEPCRITWILEFVPAPLISPVTTATLYTIPGGIRNLVRKKKKKGRGIKKRWISDLFIGFTLGSAAFPPVFLTSNSLHLFLFCTYLWETHSYLQAVWEKQVCADKIPVIQPSGEKICVGFFLSPYGDNWVKKRKNKWIDN